MARGVWPWMDQGCVARGFGGKGLAIEGAMGAWLDGSRSWMDQGCVARGVWPWMD